MSENADKYICKQLDTLFARIENLNARFVALENEKCRPANITNIQDCYVTESQASVICDFDTTDCSKPTKSAQTEPSVGAVDFLKEFAENTTLHGFAHVVRRRPAFNKWKWKNLIFVLVTVACLSFAGNNVVSMVTDYLSYPVTTTTYTNTDLPMDFPAVTICNNNKIAYHNLRSYYFLGAIQRMYGTQNEISEFVKSYLNSTVCRQAGIARQDADTGLPKHEYLCYPHTNISSVTDVELSLYHRGHPLASICDVRSYLFGDDPTFGEQCFFKLIPGLLNDCTFGGSACDVSDFRWSYDDTYGSCYTFNGEMNMHGASDIRQIDSVGGDSELTMVFNLATFMYDTQFHDIGLRIWVHDNKERPFPGDNSIIVSPGYHSFVGFEKKQVVRQTPPYGKCIELTEEQHRDKSFYADQFIYSQTACHKTCKQIHAMLFCGCCLESYPCLQIPSKINSTYQAEQLQDISVCNVTEAAENCTQQNTGSKFLEECQSECHPPCSSTHYHLSLSASKWPPQNPLVVTKHELTGNDDGFYEEELFYPSQTDDNIGYTCNRVGRLCRTSRDLEWYWAPFAGGTADHMYRAENLLSYIDYTTNHVKVTVYPTTLEVTKEVTTPKYDWVGFLSNIGGVMGLFTGFSVLSFLEIVELLFDLGACLFAVLWGIKQIQSSVSP